MDAREGTKRKDACLNAVSPITCSQAPCRTANQRALRRWLFVFEVYIDCPLRSTTFGREKFSNLTETERLGDAFQGLGTVREPKRVA